MKKIKILELFGGIGAPRAALENLGYDIKAIDYVEIDKYAVTAYNALYEHLKQPESVIGYNLKPDILIHGSPCQTYSSGGYCINGDVTVARDMDEYLQRLENGEEVKSDLMFETLRIIENMGQWKPSIVIWENVPSVLQDRNIASFEAYTNYMEEMGYHNTWEVLEATEFGIPQGRKRLFCISKLYDTTPFNFSNLERKRMQPLRSFLEQEVDDSYTLRQPSMLKAIDGCRILDPNDPYICAKTLTTKQWRWNINIVPINEAEYRTLTEREYWRLMGFTDKQFEQVAARVSKTQLYKLAGNSIVVPVLEAIFKELLKEQ